MIIHNYVEKKFIRKRYTGYTSGTYLGRDDGHPVDCEIMIPADDLERLVSEVGKDENEKFSLVKQQVRDLTEAELNTLIEVGRSNKKQRLEAEERAADEAEFERLKEKLGK